MSQAPSGWVVAELGEVVDVLDHLRVPVNRAEREDRLGGIPYYGATGQVGWIDKPLFDEELCLLGEDGAPFLEPSRPKAYVIDGPSWVNNHAHVLRARREVILTKFLKYALDQVGYREFVTGTTRLKLTKSAMLRIPVPAPPLAEQRRIVAAIEEQLSRLDDAEASFHRVRRKLDVLRAAVLTAATAGLHTEELGSLVTDLRYGTSMKCAYESTGVPVLRIPNVQAGRVDTSDLKFAVDPSIDLSSFMVGPDDLLFVRTNGSRNLIGRVAAVGSVEGMAFASYLIRARLKRSAIEPGFAAYALSTPSQRALIEAKAATTAGQYNLNLAALRSLPVPLPPLDEQRRIVAELERRLSLIDALAAATESALRRSAALRRAILGRAFRGELVPQDPADEPASALLERIRASRSATGTTGSPRRRDRTRA